MSDTPKKIDLSKPDAGAAELAGTLQTVVANSMFTRLMLWITRGASFFLIWIVRPLVWWPLKAMFFAIIWGNSPNEKSRREQQRIKRRRVVQRREDERRWQG